MDRRINRGGVEAETAWPKPLTYGTEMRTGGQHQLRQFRVTLRSGQSYANAAQHPFLRGLHHLFRYAHQRYRSWFAAGCPFPKDESLNAT